MAQITSLSIRDKFLVTPLISAVLAIILYFIFVSLTENHSTQVHQAEEQNSPLIHRIHLASIALIKHHATLGEELIPPESSSLKTAKVNAFPAELNRLTENLISVSESFEPYSQEDTQRILALTLKINEYQQANLAFIGLARQLVSANTNENASSIGTSSKAIAEQTYTALTLANSKLTTLLDSLEELSLILEQRRIEQIEAADNNFDQHGIVTVMTIVFIILITGLGLYLANHMSSSIEAINNAMISLAKNDLAIKLPPKDDSYIGQLVHAVEQFKLSLEKNQNQHQMLNLSLSQLQETNQRYFNFLDMTAIAILAINHKQEIVLFNKTAEEVFGYNKEEIIGKHLSILLPEKFRDQHKGIVDNFSRSNLEYITMQPKDSIKGMKKNGEEFLLEAHVAKLSLENETLMTAAITDITERRKTIEALADSERQQKDILNNTSSVIYVKDLQGRYLFINRMFEKLFHITDEEARGKTDHDIFPSDIADTFRTNDVMVASHQDLMELEEVNHVDGIEHTYFSVKFPLRNRAGDIYAISGISTDITNRIKTEQRLVRSEARFRSLFQSAVVGIIVAGEELGIIKEWNSGAQRIFGYKPKEILNKPISELLPDSYLASHQEGYSHAYSSGELSHGGTTHELTGVRKSGEHFPLALTLSTWKEGNSRYFSAMFIDITDRKAAEAELKQHQDQLEELIEARTQELEASFENLAIAQNQLVESEKMAALGGLVAGISHEVNTPIGIGVTAASHLADITQDFEKHFAKGQLTAEEVQSFIQTNKEVAEILSSNMQRAANLIRSFKQVAVDQSSEATREFELREYINEILTSLKPKFKNKPYEIKINCPHKIMLNSVPGALAQVFTNLLMNSLIHGFDGQETGEIIVTITQNKQQVEINYQDSGKGIPAKDLDKIFEPFFTTRRGKGGSGLGMHIVYNLVTDTLGGDIKCSSEEGKGTQFFITLPINISQ